MLQLLQTMMADREAERAERQANLAALQQIAQNNQGHGNHDHPGSKLKNFQNTNPPMFSKTEEPLDADDWLQTIENNLEVAGVEAAEKVLFATHYLSGPARAWWTSTRAMNNGQIMNWADFKLKFSKYHVPQGLIKKMRDEFRELKQGRMTVVEYRDKFLTLSRYAPDETDTDEKRRERFLNGLHDEMQTVLVNIPFADLEALVDSAIQMEGKLHQATENRKRRMMNQSGPHHNQRHRNHSTGGLALKYNKPPAQSYRPNHTHNNGGPPKPGGNPNNNHSNTHSNNHHPNGNNNNTNTGPRTGSNATPITTKDKATITCYNCGTVGHYSKECPNKLAKTVPNTAAPAQQQRRFAGRRNQNNNNGRFYHMEATEAQEVLQTMPTMEKMEGMHPCIHAVPMPATSTPLFSLALLSGNDHVHYTPMHLLIMTVHGPNSREHRIGQNPTRPDAPMPVVARQSAHGHRPGRASTPRRLVAVELLPLSPCACTFHTSPGHRRTPPLALTGAVDDAIIKLCRAGTARTTMTPPTPVLP
ncbi:hypothetical protein QYE76_069010 [Lolium multiflorum]|uniref:CCHC-type domain-containing protein n=2 Tax=Lolium multiflorum TaxID=4521 RepID=A0AAD8SFH2_LOLMU|nr:hypothetical protein QYE76_069010 [Lolium multiflorum]